jgi:hypothetical protein
MVALGLGRGSGGYVAVMTDLIVAFVLMLVAITGAEAVRMTCRRQMLSPVRPQRAPSTTSAGRELQLSS